MIGVKTVVAAEQSAQRRSQVYIIATRHATAQDADLVSAKLDELSAKVNKFVIGFEFSGIRSNVFRNLPNMNARDIRLLASQNPDFNFKLLMKIRELGEHGIPAYQIDVARNISAYKIRLTEVCHAYERVASQSTFREKLLPAIAFAEKEAAWLNLREAKMAKSIRALSRLTNVPVTVVVGYSHAPRLQTQLNGHKVTILPTAVEYPIATQINENAFRSAAKSAKEFTPQDLLNISRYLIIVELNQITIPPVEIFKIVGSLKSVKSAEALFTTLIRKR